MSDEEKKPRGRPKHKEVTVTAPNVWTSKGKLLVGETASLPPDEAKDLKNKGFVE